MFSVRRRSSLPRWWLLLIVHSASFAHPVLAGPRAPAVPALMDMARLITCQEQPEQFMTLAIAAQDPVQMLALGWRPSPQINPFLSEYVLPAPISVYGYLSARVAFAGSSVLAILDLPDPRPLARQLDLETAVDTPEKAMFGKEVLSEEFTDPISGTAQVRSAVLNLSTVTSHPGKTLLGCTYSIDTLEDEADPGRPAH